MIDGYSKDAIDAKFGELRAEVRASTAEVHRVIDAVDAKLSGEISAFKVDVTKQIGELRGDFREFKGWMLGIGAVIGVVIPIITGVVMFWLNRQFPAVPHP